MFRRTSLPFFASAAVVLFLVSCGQRDGRSDDGSAAERSALDRLRAASVIRVGFANEAPFAYLDQATGRLTGEAPEVARVVLRRLGIEEIDGVLTEFGSLIPGLKAKRFDLIAAGMYLTPKRCKEIAFSNPTYSTGEAFIVKQGNPKNLHGYEDAVGREDALLGVVVGTVEHDYALRLVMPDARIVVFPDPPSAMAGVRAGRVDAFAGTSLTVNDLLAKAADPTIERASPFVDPVIDGKTVRGFGGFGFRKGDSALVDAFNEELSRFIGTPEHLDLIAPFGFTELELPGEATAAELCDGTPGEDDRLSSR